MSGHARIESHQAILSVLQAIPSGRVCTYGSVARLAGQPGKARLVGYILKWLPADSTLPWHRVVNAQGRISFPENAEQHKLQRTLLQNEGLQFEHNGRIRLDHYGWQG
jgi:methylated-DNA-protein-cysteine methyltransferase-like protein